MHRHKIIPPTLLILSFINVLLAAPVVLREVCQGCADMTDAGVPEDVTFIPESEKRSDELWDEPWQKRAASTGSSPVPVGEPIADQGLATNPPPSAPAGTSRIQDAASVSSLEIKLPSDEDYYASDEGGQSPGLTKSYSDSSSNTRIIGVGSYPGTSPGSTQSYPPWNRPELASNKGGPWSTKSYPPSDGSESDLASNEGTKLAGPGPIMTRPSASTRPQIEPFPWNPHDWSETSSEAEPQENFMSNSKSFFDKLVYKFKFWPRGPVL